MTVVQPEAQSFSGLEDSRADQLGVKVPVVPSFRLGPEVWNWFYYAVLAISLFIGLIALFNSGSIIEALLYFFVTLMATAVLSTVFLSFVIMPLCVKHHHRMVEARRAAILAARAAAIEKAERERAERYQTLMAQLEDEANLVGHASDAPAGTPLPQADSEIPGQGKTNVEDQASSLRQMVAERSTVS